MATPGEADGVTPTESPVTTATLDSTLGALPVPAYANDLAGYVTWQNEAARELMGDLRGVHFSAAVTADDLPRARQTWAAVTLSGATTRRKGSYRAADGKLVRLEAIAAPMRRNGRIVGVFGVCIPWNEGTREDAKPELSPRQLDVLRLLVQAKSTSQIAEELHLAPETVRNHIASLLKALGARNRLEAALLALRHGLVSLDLD